MRGVKLASPCMRICKVTGRIHHCQQVLLQVASLPLAAQTSIYSLVSDMTYSSNSTAITRNSMLLLFLIYEPYQNIIIDVLVMFEQVWELKLLTTLADEP